MDISAFNFKATTISSLVSPSLLISAYSRFSCPFMPKGPSWRSRLLRNSNERKSSLYNAETDASESFSPRSSTISS